MPRYAILFAALALLSALLGLVGFAVHNEGPVHVATFCFLLVCFVALIAGSRRDTTA